MRLIFDSYVVTCILEEKSCALFSSNLLTVPKGLEYDNVIMFFGDSFGRSKSYFNNFFAGYNQELKDNELESYRKARNLLYVAATRARINLRILYTGDYQSKKESFDIIFGKVDLWKKEDNSGK